MARKDLDQLERELDTLRSALTLPEDGRGRCFVHLKTGDYYVALDVGFRESNMTIEVTYHPLRKPRVKFYRPFVEFSKNYKPVKHP